MAENELHRRITRYENVVRIYEIGNNAAGHAPARAGDARDVTIVLIEHIMRAVMRFSQRLVVLVSGKNIADEGPENVIRDPEVEKTYLGR